MHSSGVHISLHRTQYPQEMVHTWHFIPSSSFPLHRSPFYLENQCGDDKSLYETEKNFAPERTNLESHAPTYWEGEYHHRRRGHCSASSPSPRVVVEMARLLYVSAPAPPRLSPIDSHLNEHPSRRPTIYAAYITGVIIAVLTVMHTLTRTTAQSSTGLLHPHLILHLVESPSLASILDPFATPPLRLFNLPSEDALDAEEMTMNLPVDVCQNQRHCDGCLASSAQQRRLLPNQTDPSLLYSPNGAIVGSSGVQMDEVWNIADVFRCVAVWGKQPCQRQSFSLYDQNASQLVGNFASDRARLPHVFVMRFVFSMELHHWPVLRFQHLLPLPPRFLAPAHPLPTLVLLLAMSQCQRTSWEADD